MIICLLFKQSDFFIIRLHSFKIGAVMKKTLLILLTLTLSSVNVLAEDADLKLPLDFSDDIQTDNADFSPFEIQQRPLSHKIEVPDTECPKDIQPETQADVPSEKAQEIDPEVTAQMSDFPPNSKSGAEIETIAPKVYDKSALQDKVAIINLIDDDTQKIIEWSKASSAQNYLIINKKNCTATVYDKDGNALKTFEIGIGRDIGDDFNDTSGLTGKSRNTTPAGEFALIKNVFHTSAYGDMTLSLGTKANKSKKSKKMVALHKVPKFRQERLGKFKDDNLSNNRMSHGCINFLEKDFKELTKYIKGGFKVYILPEEEGNHLILMQNENHDFEFMQTKH